LAYRWINLGLVELAGTAVVVWGVAITATLNFVALASEPVERAATWVPLSWRSAWVTLT